MVKTTFPKGIINVTIDGVDHLAEYVGRQESFECIICGKGSNAFTFNILESKESYAQGNYETWGFGRDHLHHVILKS